jgi:hypothetical protein
MPHQPTHPAPRDFTAASREDTFAGHCDAHREAVRRWRADGSRGKRPRLLDAAEREQLRDTIRTTGRHVARMERALLARQPSRVARPRGTGARPARRAAASSSTSGSDPGGEDSEPEPPASARLRLAAPPRATLSFGCLAAQDRGAQVEQVAR